MYNQCVSLLPPAGEGEEVHAAGGQPEAARCGERLHVQQAYLCPLQHRTEVLLHIKMHTHRRYTVKIKSLMSILCSECKMLYANTHNVQQTQLTLNH